MAESIHFHPSLFLARQFNLAQNPVLSPPDRSVDLSHTSPSSFSATGRWPPTPHAAPFSVLFPWIRLAKESSNTASKREKKASKGRRQHRTRASKESGSGTQRELGKFGFFPRKGIGPRRAGTVTTRVPGRRRDILPYLQLEAASGNGPGVPIRSPEVGEERSSLCTHSFSLCSVCSAGFVQGWRRAEQVSGVLERYMSFPLICNLV
jgi:hypothetical protein